MLVDITLRRLLFLYCVLRFIIVHDVRVLPLHLLLKLLFPSLLVLVDLILILEETIVSSISLVADLW